MGKWEGPIQIGVTRDMRRTGGSKKKCEEMKRTGDIEETMLISIIVSMPCSVQNRLGSLF